MRTIEWRDGVVCLIDQRLLPRQEVWREYRDYRGVAQAIVEMQIRGAPAIGAAAAYGVALAALHSPATTSASLLADVEEAIAELGATRPTAVNLFWALERMRGVAQNASTAGGPELVRAALVAEAKTIADEDVETNRRMAEHGQHLIADGMSLLTHCNAGALATVDIGTSLGVIRAAHDAGKRIHVFVDETRPFLQGARLTAWELQRWGVPLTLITDNMAGHFISRGQVDAILVGADRIAANGDTANKIGTYTLAVLAHENGVPFYVVAPTSTVDLNLATGAAIPIEERRPEEVTHICDVPIAPEGVPVANPAFDVTPHRYITGIVTEKGVIYPPFAVGLKRAVHSP
ncbi:MAG: S-methyl-5-thioribose-1-phosphate isomerase [Anaerolineae bacterium]